MLRKIFGANRDLALVIAVLAILLVLFAPIPAPLLDLLIILNFAFALTVLLMTLYVDKPVSFSTFPSLLLVGTLFRLALNVSATRLILTEAHAGEVIGSIGAFAAGGSFVIGMVVFFILVIVQYVVVTSGAQRVSEVAARFTLDSVPGQQMSIDADLNMGLIDQNEAKRRRKTLEKEASFYGAMDGASKFVKGDAIAGVIILLINILAGWIIGMAQMGMDWLHALQTFTLLTIGDGIVTQVPALIISTATGIIVTRSGSDRQLSAEVLAQLTSNPKIPLIVVGALLVLLALPGMPKWPILILIAGSAAIWYSSRKKAKTDDLVGATLDSTEEDPRAAAEGKAAPPIEIRLGRQLSQHWQSLKPVLSDRISSLRSQQEKTSGFAFPAVVFHDGSQLEDNTYQILLFGARHAQGRVFPELLFAARSKESDAPLPGVEGNDPAFGLPGTWITEEHRDQAEAAHYTLIDPITVLMTHLAEVLKSQAPLLLGRSDVVAMIEGVRLRQPGLIEELIPALMTLSDIQRILQNLLGEDVSIRSIDLIVEALVDVARISKDHNEITELVRQRLSHAICDQLRGDNDQLSVLSLNPRMEAQIADSVRRSDASSPFVLEPRLAEQLLKGLIVQCDAMLEQGKSAVLLCGPEVRRHLKAFTRRTLPRMSIISVNEVPSTIDLASFAVVSADNNPHG